LTQCLHFIVIRCLGIAFVYDVMQHLNVALKRHQ